MIEELRRDSADGLSLAESVTYTSGRLGAADGREAVQLITAEPDQRSYHLLMAVLRDAPALDVPAEVRAGVLAGALAHLLFLNDFGYLDPSGSWDGPAAEALLDTGPAAVPALGPRLGDTRPAPLLGSENATLSHVYGYRRCDFAYRYAMLALQEEPEFDADPTRRDVDLAALQNRLA